MKIMKRMLLMLLVIMSLLALSACSSSKPQEPVPEDIRTMMLNGAESYLNGLTSYSEADLAEQMRIAEKQQNTVLQSGITSWLTAKDDVGAMLQITDEQVERTGDYSYKAVITADFEKRPLTFTLGVDQGSDGVSYEPVEINFTPNYTLGEKMAKAGMNTIMGMGTVFLVLIFISFLIAQFKHINNYERKKNAAKEAEAAAARAAAAQAAAARAAAAPAPAPVPIVPVPVKKEEPAPAPVKPEVLKEELKEELIEELKEELKPAQTAAEEPNPEEDLELVAVITAAISAATSVPADELIVRSIRRRPYRRRFKGL